MNKRIFFTAPLVALAMSAFSISALAQQAVPTRKATQTQATSATTAVATLPTAKAQVVTPASVAKTPAHKPAASALDSRSCIRHTGSHIPPAKGKCLPVAGRSYSQQDIWRTGATDVGHALQMLDPSVRVGGGH